ncbi:hypothetical protein INT47_006918 [Mucor saturninus]|uniref:Uncharacterized protein n=1 Tax=Mucor saturninus TaxID=64648 RepID=A0A8H7QIE3_9FUNG|nr:hypothetical protein INT47_006918 [Mucor saturninus]
MFGTINFNAPSSSTASTSSTPIEDDRTRGPNWSGEKYTEILIEHNELARRQNLRSLPSEEQKKKWKCMVKDFKEEFARRQSTGESGFEPDVVYEKLEEILTKLPTILPPVTYSSHSRHFVDVTNGVYQGSSTAPAESSRVETPPPNHASTATPPANPSTTSPPNPSPTPQPTNPSSALPRHLS